MPTTQLLSFGAAHTVTGSNHLLDMAGVKILMDCGLFQGSAALEARNHESFPFAPAEIDAMVLSHAHLDHAGRVPKLVREGYRGPIYCREATFELARQLLLDAAKIQNEDFERASRKGLPAEPPLYDAQDVERALEQFMPLEYGPPKDYGLLKVGDVQITAQVAGHIPGSASLLFEANGERVVFSGDLGNIRKDVLPDPTPCPPADLVLMESTYGDRDHRPFAETLAEFAETIAKASETSGKIIIPSFALERTQDLLFHIARLEEQGRIPALPVYVDSPLAIRIEDTYERHMHELSEEVLEVAKHKQPFMPQNLRYSVSRDESKAINSTNGAAIIIAGSGMMTGGRVLHHLKHCLPQRSTSVVIVGYQPQGGLGRLLIDGAQSVKIYGDQIPVRGAVHTIGGFSAHADRTELLAWSASAGSNAEVRLVHGEMAAMERLQAALVARGQRASIQTPGDGRAVTAADYRPGSDT
jgi:metallo-beta-lactamase family protein